MPKGIFKRTREDRKRLKVHILNIGEGTRFKKGHKTNTGKHWKVKDVSKMSASHIGKPSPRKGAILSDETKMKISESLKNKPRYKMRGANSFHWRGGVTPLNMKIRKSLKYKMWRESVFERDNYTCIFCELRGGWNKKLKRRIMLNADHIKPFSLFPELRFNIDNGRTLCKECHGKTETIGMNQYNIKVWKHKLSAR